MLLIFTTTTKNSTKEIENKIYNTKENLRILEHKYQMVLLDFNYLSSPKKLLEYQSLYFENDLKEIDITTLKKLTLAEDEIQIKRFVDIENDNTGLTGVTVINNADGIIKQEGAKDGAVFAEFQVNFTLINSGTISSNDGQAVNIKQTTNAIITNNTTACYCTMCAYKTALTYLYVMRYMY